MNTQQTEQRTKNNSFWLKGKMDFTFFSLVLILLTTGLLMLFSSSYAFALVEEGDSYHYIKRQLVFAVIGIFLMLIISKINYRFYRKFVWIIYGIAVVLLGALLVLPPLVPGATQKRWIPLGPITFQPSEIGKFALVLVLAHLISKNYKRMGEFKYGIGTMGFITASIGVLVMLETHLSAAIIIFGIGIVMMIVGGINLKYLVFLLVPVVIIGIAVIASGYGVDRFTYWLNPEADATGKGYQTLQSLMAIGSGGLFGRGFCQSRQKYLWVPEPHNDFIFSIVCEELGLIGAMVIILLFCALVWRGFSIAMKAPDKFGSLMCVGLVFQVGFQAVLNILVVTNTLPNTGISLPFFSYGGTALVVLLAEMGVVLSISRCSKIEKR
jgi:cell division protein FtsW